MPSRSLASLALSLTLLIATVAAARGEPLLPEGAIELNDNGAWSWFMDPRAIIDRGRLLVGSVRATGPHRESRRPGWGNVELAVWDLEEGKTQRIVLHERLEQDDHNSPGLLVLPDGRYLAAYSEHSQDRRIYWRVSTSAGNPYEWDAERTIDSPGEDGAPFGGDNVTYMNPFRLNAEPGRLYLFYRGYSHDPNYLISTDNAASWTYGGHWLIGRDGYAPYLKYASDGEDTIHFVTTEDHPRNFDNSLYHGFLRSGQLHKSDGQVVGPLSTDSQTSIHTWDFTRVFQGDADHVAWMTDLELDDTGRPVILFTVQRAGEGLPRGQGGEDHRFYYARWDGEKWDTHEIAYAGKRLYPTEDDYTGLGAIDPGDVTRLVISTDAHPETGEPLISKTDGRRHHELFQGATADRGATWQWTPLTRDSDADNLRPLIPGGGNEQQMAVVWMRGSYSHNRGPWTTRVMGAVVPRD